MNIVLLEPEIPQNTGNIGRTCCATGTKLHLIEPMGFRINEKSLKRAGMDYWENLDVTIYDSYRDFMEKNPGARKHRNDIRMWSLDRMILLCSEKRVQEYRKKY